MAVAQAVLNQMRQKRRRQQHWWQCQTPRAHIHLHVDAHVHVQVRLYSWGFRVCRLALQQSVSCLGLDLKGWGWRGGGLAGSYFRLKAVCPFNSFIEGLGELTNKQAPSFLQKCSQYRLWHNVWLLASHPHNQKLLTMTRKWQQLR